MDYFEQGQRYEVMSEVAKLLQPFYEDARDSKVYYNKPNINMSSIYRVYSIFY